MSGRQVKKSHPADNIRTRILLVDDHPIVRRGLAQLINYETDLFVCGEAGSAQEALSAIEKLQPQVIVLDLSLGNTNGISLIKDIRNQYGPIPILILSMHDENLYAERALRAGALGYIMKEEATERVIEAVRRVLRGEIHLSEKIATRLLHNLVGGSNTNHNGGSSIEALSNRELEIFELTGRGMSTRAIADKLNVSIKTVEAHRANIKHKLRLNNSIELLQHATHWVQAERHLPQGTLSLRSPPS